MSALQPPPPPLLLQVCCTCHHQASFRITKLHAVDASQPSCPACCGPPMLAPPHPAPPRPTLPCPAPRRSAGMQLCSRCTAAGGTTCRSLWRCRAALLTWRPACMQQNCWAASFEWHRPRVGACRLAGDSSFFVAGDAMLCVWATPPLAHPPWNSLPSLHPSCLHVQTGATGGCRALWCETPRPPYSWSPQTTDTWWCPSRWAQAEGWAGLGRAGHLGWALVCTHGLGGAAFRHTASRLHNFSDCKQGLAGLLSPYNTAR